ncbi:MAG: hypothetical protein KA165_05015 [Saprospiraceae bacterium]|nr:hypothetical protein [Saprospiraceae bacterium]
MKEKPCREKQAEYQQRPSVGMLRRQIHVPNEQFEHEIDKEEVKQRISDYARMQQNVLVTDVEIVEIHKLG